MTPHPGEDGPSSQNPALARYSSMSSGVTIVTPRSRAYREMAMRAMGRARGGRRSRRAPAPPAPPRPSPPGASTPPPPRKPRGRAETRGRPGGEPAPADLHAEGTNELGLHGVGEQGDPVATAWAAEGDADRPLLGPLDRMKPHGLIASHAVELHRPAPSSVSRALSRAPSARRAWPATVSGCSKT